MFITVPRCVGNDGELDAVPMTDIQKRSLSIINQVRMNKIPVGVLAL